MVRDGQFQEDRSVTVELNAGKAPPPPPKPKAKAPPPKKPKPGSRQAEESNRRCEHAQLMATDDNCSFSEALGEFVESEQDAK